MQMLVILNKYPCKTSILWKLLEHTVHSNMMKYLDEYKV